MDNLFIMYETFTNGYKIETLEILSLICVVSGIFVIVSKNPIISVLFLIGLFLSISSYLIIMGMNFIGLSYLLVYVGAVSILFLFILMLINVRISELVSDASNSIPLGIFIVIAFNYPLYKILPYSLTSFNSYIFDLSTSIRNLNNSSYYINVGDSNPLSDKLNAGDILFVTSKVWDGNLSDNSHINTIGSIMYSTYNIWLIITSIILLLAMVGAIVITIKQDR